MVNIKSLALSTELLENLCSHLGIKKINQRFRIGRKFLFKSVFEKSVFSPGLQ